MTSIHHGINERLTVEHCPEAIENFGPEIASLLRRAGVGHFYPEHIVPLHSAGGLVAALATRPLTWPSAGSRAQEAEALAVAAVGAGKRALLAPVITAPHHRLNLGLLAATQRSLLQALTAAECKQVALLVRDGALAEQAVLSAAGFAPSSTVAVTDHASYIAYCAAPEEVIRLLGIAGLRQGDLLALRVDPDTLRRIALFHLGISAAAQPYFDGRPEWATILPGLAGWGAYPIDGGINTPSPGPRLDDIEIDILRPGT